jgi:hypothetical protein
MKSYVNDIKEVRKINDHDRSNRDQGAVPHPSRRDPRLVYMMSKKWCETNQATRPVDRRKGIENAASFRANGTGPFRLRERQPNVRTGSCAMAYWGKIEGNVGRSDLHAHRQRCHARRGAAVGRDRRDGARAGAGRRSHQCAPMRIEVLAARNCAPSSWAWTRSATNCCSPT